MFNFGNKDKVEISETSEGSHGDHWSAIFGFENQDDMEAKVTELIDDLEYECKINKNTHKHRAKYGMLSAIGIQDDDSLTTLYPSLFPSKNIPINIKSILEWTHSDCNEAQILGSGRDTFALNFFAIDYPEKKKKYKKGGNINIALAGLAYVIDKHEPSDMPEEFSNEFCSYLPSSDLPTGYDYDFIGKVVSANNIKFKNEELFLFEVKLINDDTNNMFTLPIVANPANMRINDVSPGDMITGCFWLQGRIFG